MIGLLALLSLTVLPLHIFIVTSCQDRLTMENEDTEREKNESPSAVKKDGNNKMIVLILFSLNESI